MTIRLCDLPYPLIPLDAEHALCEHCGYDLRGAVCDRCPECGGEFSPFELQLRSQVRCYVRGALTGPNIFHMWAIHNWIIFIGLLLKIV